MIIIFQHLLLH